jgi:hypothetical protein
MPDRLPGASNRATRRERSGQSFLLSTAFWVTRWQSDFCRWFERQLQGAFGSGGQVADQADTALGREFHTHLDLGQLVPAHGLQVGQDGGERRGQMSFSD